MEKFDYELYGWNTPNGQKVLIALEEAKANYRYIPVDITVGQQKTTAFKQLSPDGKIPALVHHTAMLQGSRSPVKLFESGAILLYLANQFPMLHGRNDAEKAQVMSWTFWQVGQLGPIAGQFGRFHSLYAQNAEAINHFHGLIERCLAVMETQLARSTYLVGEKFTVADIACLPWIASEQSYLQRYEFAWRENYPMVCQWADGLLVKPSVRSALGNPGGDTV